MGDHEPDADHALGDRLLDLLVFAPAGAMLSLVEEFPRLAERGRERLGVRISSARAVGHFVVTAGGHELKRRSTRMVGGGAAPGGPAPGGPSRGVARTPPWAAPTDRSPGTSADRSPGAPRPGPAVPPASSAPGRSATSATPSPPAGDTRTAGAPAADHPVPGSQRPVGARPAGERGGEDHIPAVDSLAIPGFDSLSASQVVQRLDGLNRQELVSVRAYELATRGRRTILSRVDQLLEARA